MGGRDLATLSEALLYAGAVVATLWPIQDHPAATFAGHFYDALGTAAPARALAEAQRRMLSDPDTRPPFYWADTGSAGGDGPWALAPGTESAFRSGSAKTALDSRAWESSGYAPAPQEPSHAVPQPTCP